MLGHRKRHGAPWHEVQVFSMRPHFLRPCGEGLHSLSPCQSDVTAANDRFPSILSKNKGLMDG